MKEKSLKKRMVSALRTCIFIMITAMLLLPAMETQAASAKSKALKAYKKMLSKNSITWNKDGYKFPLSDSEFGLAYIDKDNVPELIVQNNRADHASGFGRLYTYKNGKVVMVAKINLCELDSVMNAHPFSYYKKLGVFSYCDIAFGIQDQYFYKMSGTTSTYANLTKSYGFDSQTRKYKLFYSIKKPGKGLVRVTKAQFNKKLKKLVGSKKATPLKLYKNTKKNRNKYLK